MHGRHFESDQNIYYPNGFADHETSTEFHDGQWRREIVDYEGLAAMQRQMGSNNYSRNAKYLREAFRDF